MPAGTPPDKPLKGEIVITRDRIVVNAVERAQAAYDEVKELRRHARAELDELQRLVDQAERMYEGIRQDARDASRALGRAKAASESAIVIPLDADHPGFDDG